LLPGIGLDQISSLFMRHRILLTLFLLPVLATPVLHAEDAPVRVTAASQNAWTLPALIEQLTQNNPQLRSARAAVSAAELGVEPAKALDNPTLNITQDPIKHNPLSLGTSTAMAWGVTQNFPWPGKRRLAGEIVQAQADAAREQAVQLKIQLVGQLRTAWIGWQQLNAQIRLSRAQLKRLDQIKDITKIRYANNAAAYGDFINAQVNQAQLQTDVLGLERQLQVMSDQIAVLIGTSEPIQLAVVDATATKDVPLLSAFEQQALAFNPQLKSSQYAIESARKNVELAELGKRPDFSIGVTAHASTPPWSFGSSDSYGVSAGVTFPLYYGQKEKNLIDQAKVLLISANDADESLKQQVLFSVRSAYHQWAQGLDQLKVIEDRVIQQAMVGYRLTLVNYTNGQANYVDLLNAFNTLKAAEISLEQARANAIQARIALDVAVGNQQ
jgi:outer membrane protein, heavy metal efflux system